MAPVDRMFLVTAWLESILYGMNLVIFGACMYILLNRKKKAHWIIPASCILHISIATAHNILCHLRALQGFTNHSITSTPNGSTLYFLRLTTALSMANWGLYIFNVLAANLLLIWRLYVVWQCIWILIVMLTLEAAHITTAVASWALVIQSGQVFSRTVVEFGNACFAFNLAITISITSGIAYRLWRAGRAISPYTGRNVYKAAIYTVVESGALYTASFVVQTGLLISRSAAGFMAIDVNTQIATMAPLLLIAGLGLGWRDKGTAQADSSTFAQPIQVNVTEEISTYPMDSRSDFTPKSARSCPDSNEGNIA